MQFIETRGNDGEHQPSVSFSTALLSPSASFGGIYSPAELPAFESGFLDDYQNASYKTLAKKVLKHFQIDVDESIIDQALSLYDGFDTPSNPVPMVRISEKISVSELYHGPTRAFKDMALQPFGVILSALAKRENLSLLILAATSGDTGPAALDTFRNQDNIRVACLYPDGGTSDVQRLQMVTESASNLKVIGIHGNFDDAQSSLKSLLSSDSFKANLDRKGISLSAANSVNFGRIIFQIVYHIHAYLSLLNEGSIKAGEEIVLHVPSGNFGNALGGFYAKKLGIPIKRIVIASNANNVLTDFINTGIYDIRHRDLIITNSPAMDILKSSNVERVLFALYGAERTRDLMFQLDNNRHYQLNEDELAKLQEFFSASFSSDSECLEAVKTTFKLGYLMDPHTANCIKSCAEDSDKDMQQVIYSTAEWTKFAPAISKAISGIENQSDEEALITIATKAGISIPASINQLFERDVIHQDVVDPAKIEETVLTFLEN